MCSWSNTQNIKMDQLDWELTSQEAGRHYSIPPEDHTLGTERGKPEREIMRCTSYQSRPWESGSRESNTLIICKHKTYFMYVCPFVCVFVYPTCTKNVLKCKIDYLPFPFCQVTSCSFQAATGRQPIKTLSCWALTCPRPRAPAWNSGSTSRTHVRTNVLNERLYLVHLWSHIQCSSCCCWVCVMHFPFDVLKHNTLFFPFFFFDVRSGHRAEGVEAVWRSSPSVVGGGWSGRTVETLRHQHHIYWGIPGQTHTIYTKIRSASNTLTLTLTLCSVLYVSLFHST